MSSIGRKARFEKALGRRSWRLALCLALAACANGVVETAACAQLPETIAVTLPDCATPPFSREVFLEVVRVELASHDIAMRANGSDAEGEIAIALDRCAVDAPNARMVVTRSETGTTEERRVVFTVTGLERRGRVLALAAAEFATLKWASLGEPDPPPAPEIDVAALEARIMARQNQELERRLAELRTSPAEEQDPPTWLIGLGPRIDFFPEYSSAAAGPAIWASRGFGRHVRLRLDAFGGFGRGRALQGNIRIRTVAAGVSGLFGGGSRAWVGIGPRAEIGWARLQGVAFEDVTLTIERSVQELVGSAGVHAAARITVGRHWAIAFDAVAAYGFKRVDGVSDGNVQTGVGGTTASLMIGAAYAIP